MIFLTPSRFHKDTTHKIQEKRAEERRGRGEKSSVYTMYPNCRAAGITWLIFITIFFFAFFFVSYASPPWPGQALCMALCGDVQCGRRETDAIDR